MWKSTMEYRTDRGGGPEGAADGVQRPIFFFSLTKKGRATLKSFIYRGLLSDSEQWADCLPERPQKDRVFSVQQTLPACGASLYHQNIKKKSHFRVNIPNPNAWTVTSGHLCNALVYSDIDMKETSMHTAYRNIPFLFCTHLTPALTDTLD